MGVRVDRMTPSQLPFMPDDKYDIFGESVREHGDGRIRLFESHHMPAVRLEPP